MDSEIAAVLAAAMETSGVAPATARGDAFALRASANLALAGVDAGTVDSPNVTSEDHQITVADGSSILVRWYTKSGSNPGSAIVYLHGGGMICGSVDLYHRTVSNYVEQTGVPFLSVDYRLAPEFSGTTLVDDSHSALVWLVDRADELEIDPGRIAVMGDSGGGGVAAGVAIAAREAGTPLAAQILMYPMLDDRNLNPDPHIEPFAAIWTYDNNYTGWHALLGDHLGTFRVPPVTAPARLKEFTGLAPAFIDVGDLDIFRDEDISYAQKLLGAGVPCELHVRAGSLHGFDRLAPNASVSAASWNDRYRVITGI
ncbi:alpha/beta hydrolase [Paenarthrobacter sp. NPDC058040]|uniref:alpha/beta hydrolase n=1 Tax=unclassified Paenarthrobacter TaxID=2634190 RepID=UPI0036DF2750